MALKTKIDSSSFRGLLHSKVLGLPLPVVAVGGGVVAVILWRRHQAAASSQSSTASGSTGASSGFTSGDTGGASSGGGAYGGSGGYPVGIPFFPPNRRGRITQRPVRQGVLSRTVTTRKNRQGETVRTVIRRWAGGAVVQRRHVEGSGRGATRTVTRATTAPRIVAPTVKTVRRRRGGPRPARKNPRPQSVPMTHFGG
jgi:hypothetical protein